MRNIINNVSDSNSKKKKNLLQLKQDNKGAAMVMVLVIIMFISILAAILMFVSYLGYQMRLMDKRGKDTFYDAETVLDEINVGLQEEASEAMVEAYNKVMINYAVYDSTVMRSSEFYRTYIDELKKRLQGTISDDGKGDLKILRSYLSKEIVGDTLETSDDAKRARRDKFNSYGAIVESNVTILEDHDDEQYMLEYKESEYLKIKDLKVTYVDRSGYVSIISTDIKLVLPTVSFAQSSEIPRLEKFSMIADETLAMGNTAAGLGIDIKGNVYAGRMLIGRVDTVNDEHQKQNQADGKYPGIASTGFLNGTNVKFESALGAGVDNMSLVISRENIEVNQSSTLVTDNVEFWGDNVHLLSSGVNFGGITNLKDDLILEGNKSEAKLSGEYNGFSMITDDNTGAPGVGGAEDAEAEDNATNPSLSSAIIINGQESKLDLSGLENLTIAGHSYVQTKTKAGDDSLPDTQKNKSNIMMAESVAVKSNQLIYLAPQEAIGCVIENDGTIGDTAFGANPLTLKQYNEIINNKNKYLMLDGNRQVAALGYKPLKNYISQETVAGYTEKVYYPEVIFKKPANSADTLVYCYLRFTDEEKANQYFKDYYDVNSEQVDKYTRLYAKEIKMADPSAMLYLNLAGNMLVYDADQTTPAEVVTAPDNGNTSYYIRQRQAKTVFSTKTSAFSALSAKLVTDISKLSIVEQGRHAFENIINVAKMDELLAASVSNTVTIDAGTLKAIFTKSDYTVNGSTPQSSLIVSQGNVDVETNFKGLIIAAGNITVKSTGAGITLEPMDLKDFAQIMDAEIEIGANKYYVIDSFRDGINYKSSTPSASGGDATTQVALRDLIVYEQWTKK